MSPDEQGGLQQDRRNAATLPVGGRVARKRTKQSST
jgi:hypothetical protein